MSVEFGILGPLEVRAAGRAVPLGGSKPRALLALLLLHPNEPVSADALAVALWGEEAPARSTKTVHVHVSRLRKALGDPDALTTTPAGYRLHVRPHELDAERFRRLVDDGRGALAADEPEHAGALLREALALWRGPPLADLAFAPFAQGAIAALQEERLVALETRLEAELRAGRHAELVPELQRLVAEHPLRERLHGRLMLALYRAGRQADALEAYRHARATLVEQLGLEPGVELRELERAVLAQDPDLAVPAPSGAEPAAPPLVRIPAAPTPTVGRDADIAYLCAAVRDPDARLTTVVGPGGVGKTRLAAEAARAIGHEFQDGARFVSLAAVGADEHVASTICRELDVPLVAGEPVDRALVAHLRDHELLLVLDNFEHVLEAAPLVADLVAGAPRVSVLATSREPLRLRAERLMHLDPLVVPADGSNGGAAAGPPAPAVALFVAVAQARDPGFALTERNAAALLEVCRRLDGLPLAIELAAGRVDMLSVSELAGRLREGLDALGAGPRDAPARQRTLTATLEWSWSLLSPDERRAFAGLAVFAGGATLHAAEAVTGAPLDVLEALVAKNLVVARPAEDGSHRLDMLETVREFARARLAEDAGAREVHELHCDYCVGLAERTRGELERSAPPALVAELDAELNNFRAALTWALERKSAVKALRLSAALSSYWMEPQLTDEGANWLRSALALGGDAAPPYLRAAALEGLAYALSRAKTIEEADAAAQESMELRRSAGDLAGLARSTCALAVVRMVVHRVAEGYMLTREAERLARGGEDEATYVNALRLMAMMAPTLEETLDVGERAVAALRAAGNRRELAIQQANLAYTAVFHGDHVVAQRLSSEGLTAAEEFGEPHVLAHAYGNVGVAALLAGDLERAGDAFRRELEHLERYPADARNFEAMNGLAAVAAASGRDELAAKLSGAADATGLDRHDPVIAARFDERCFAPARARLGDASWSAAYAAGAALERGQVVRLAMDSIQLTPAG
jgi:predicted ATPase/DNA-binding SARP family transcriptional activator